MASSNQKITVKVDGLPEFKQLLEENNLLRKALLEGWRIGKRAVWSYWDPHGQRYKSVDTPEAALEALLERLRDAKP